MATVEGIGSVCRELGLSDEIASKLTQRLLAATDAEPGLGVETRYAAMAGREAELMQLLGAKSPDRIIHDLRNVLNELSLLKAAADLD